MVSAKDVTLVEVWRGDFLECLHHGALAVTDVSGELVLALGDVSSAMLARSALKPFQAIAMLRAGLDVTGAQLALVGASHSGEAMHLETARRILAEAGLSEAQLRTTPGLPLDPEALAAWQRAGHGKQPIAHNCSGKHAGMLRTCVRAGWSYDDYLSPSHQLHLLSAQVITEFTGDEVAQPTVDGCGAPAFATTLAGLARGFGRLAAATEKEARLLADAYRDFPEYVSGSRRDEAVLHRDVTGLIAKLGAEGTLAVGLRDGTGIAVKIGDGAHRAAITTMVAVLAALGYHTSAAPEPVLGHDKPVGRTVAAAGLAKALARWQGDDA